MKKWHLPLVALLALSGCGSHPQSVADRAIYDAIAPEHRAYVEADPELDGAQKQRRLHTLHRWDSLIRAAEAPR